MTASAAPVRVAARQSRAGARRRSRRPRGGTNALNNSELEDLSELEVYLPLGRLTPEFVDTIEPVPQINAQRSERGNERCADTSTAEQSRRVEVTRALPE